MTTLKEAVEMTKRDWILSILKDPAFEKRWHWYCLSGNANITWDIVQANPDKPWKWDSLSCNPNITWDIVQANSDKPWEWYWLSGNTNITWDIIQAYPGKPTLLAEA